MTQEDPHPWTFLTNHAHVLLCIARDHQTRIRDIAAQVGITDRAVQRIITDLEEAGYLKHKRAGRRNEYEICTGVALRHPMEEGRTIGMLLAILADWHDSKPPLS